MMVVHSYSLPLKPSVKPAWRQCRTGNARILHTLSQQP